MQPIDLIATAFLGFLAMGGMSLVLSVQRVRMLCTELARRFPSRYAEFGRPYPDFLHSPRLDAYMRLIMQRSFSTLDHRNLVEKLEALRKREIRPLTLLLTGFAVLGVAAIWFEYIDGR